MFVHAAVVLCFWQEIHKPQQHINYSDRIRAIFNMHTASLALRGFVFHSGHRVSSNQILMLTTTPHQSIAGGKWSCFPFWILILRLSDRFWYLYWDCVFNVNNGDLKSKTVIYFALQYFGQKLQITFRFLYLFLSSLIDVKCLKYKSNFVYTL